MSSRREHARRRRSKISGSQDETQFSEPEFLVIGKIRKPHGIKGEFLMAVLTDFPERIQPGNRYFLGKKHIPATIKTIRHHNKGLLVRFDEFDNPQDAGEHRNQFVFTRVEDLPPLPEGEFYQHELIGLEVVTDEGKSLGNLTEVIETGANHVYVVKPEEGKEILVPAIDDVILSVDIEAKKMLIKPLSGMLP